MPEIRKDPVIGRWIITSTDDSIDPKEYSYDKAEIKSSEKCPFCGKNSDMIENEILRRNYDGKWAVRFVENKFPALIENIKMDRYADGIYDKMTGHGMHEVIIDSHDHNTPFHEITPEEMEIVIAGMVERHRMLKKDRDLRYVLFFKNYGASAGASLSHSHSQLIATPVVPKIAVEELTFSEKYYKYKERCIFCDIVDQETEEEIRIIKQNDSFLSIVPFAPRFPFECWILPKEHNFSFGDMKKKDFRSLAIILKDYLKRLQIVFPGLPYNFVIHTAPFGNRYRDCYHWHIELMPRLTKIAGFEWGSGFYIIQTSPEKAAKILREAL